MELITDYKFNTKDSPDAKLIIQFVQKMRSGTHARGKSASNRKFFQNFSKNGTLLKFGLCGLKSQLAFFLSKNPGELCDGLF